MSSLQTGLQVPDNDAIKAVSGAALVAVRFRLQKVPFQAKIIAIRLVETMPESEQEHVIEFVLGFGAIHACCLHPQPLSRAASAPHE